MISSLLLPVFFGAALGNVIRGVPLDADGTFFLPLWTDFRPGEQPGVLDWYTVTCGVVALAALVTHGAHYLALRVERRAERTSAARRSPRDLSPAGADAGQPGGDRRRPSRSARQLPFAPGRVADPAGRRRQPGGHGRRRAARPRAVRLRRVGRLPGVDAGRRGLRPLPGAAAVDRRSGALAHHPFSGDRVLRDGRRSRLVADRLRPGCLHVHAPLPDLPRQAPAGDADGYH